MLPVGSYIVHKVLYVGLLIRAKLHDYELLNGFEQSLMIRVSYSGLSSTGNLSKGPAARACVPMKASKMGLVEMCGCHLQCVDWHCSFVTISKNVTRTFFKIHVG